MIMKNNSSKREQPKEKKEMRGNLYDGEKSQKEDGKIFTDLRWKKQSFDNVQMCRMVKGVQHGLKGHLACDWLKIVYLRSNKFALL